MLSNKSHLVVMIFPSLDFIENLTRKRVEVSTFNGVPINNDKAVSYNHIQMRLGSS